MAPNIIYCAPIPFNIVFHNANKGKMRINVLDLSRFCCALGRDRASRDHAASSFSGLVLSLSVPLHTPFTPPLFTAECATSPASTLARETTPGIFFPLACSPRIFLSKSSPLPSSSSLSTFLSLIRRSFVSLEKVFQRRCYRGTTMFRCEDVSARIVWSLSEHQRYLQTES